MTPYLWPAMAALIPLAFGPLPQPSESITLSLCSGRTVTIPIDGEEDQAPPCSAKGCHAGSCRKRFDMGQ